MDAKDSYLASLFTVCEIKRRRPRKDDPKSYNSSYQYKVFVKNQNQFVLVCFSAILSIFGIKKERLETIKRGLLTTGEPPTDQHGKHSNRPHKMTDVLRQKVRDHISSFRGRQSHYTLEKTRRIYLQEDLNINKMHDWNMFKIQHLDDKLSYESYRTVFNSDFNTEFGYPRSDICSKCDDIKLKIDATTKELTINLESEHLKCQLRELEIEQDVHQRKAETFYRRKREAKLIAHKEDDFEAIALDLKKKIKCTQPAIGRLLLPKKIYI